MFSRHLIIVKYSRKNTSQICDDPSDFESAALNYAEQLEAVYLKFSRRVSKGVRKRKGSTRIYAHTMDACFEASDEVEWNSILFIAANSRQPRVQQGNLKSILKKIDGLQVDDRGKGLILTYAENSEAVAVADRSVLSYRKYCTVHWPWNDIINEAASEGDGFDIDNNEAV